MGLQSLKTVKPKALQPNLVIDLADFDGEGTLTFRAPKAADIFPDASELRDAKIQFPEFKEPMLQSILVMGRTYVPDETDNGQAITPWRSIAIIGRENSDLFFYMLAQYGTAFPQDDITGRKEVGNDSAE